MSQQEENKSGIPTRAIHEAYLDMQRSLKRYRQAVDGGSQAGIDDAHGDVQETVLTLYELLRPHIKNNNAVNDYWDGKPPSYSHENGKVPDPDEGKGILEVQSRKDTFTLKSIDADAETIQDAESLKDWHEILGLNGTVRLTGIHVENTNAFVAYDAYQMGLRQLDDWQTEFRQKTDELDGFLGGTTEQTTERKRVKMHKLKRAARELSEIAERLGALSEFDASTPRTEITDDLIEEVEEWRQANL